MSDTFFYVTINLYKHKSAYTRYCENLKSNIEIVYFDMIFITSAMKIRPLFQKLLMRYAHTYKGAIISYNCVFPYNRSV